MLSAIRRSRDLLFVGAVIVGMAAYIIWGGPGAVLICRGRGSLLLFFMGLGFILLGLGGDSRFALRLPSGKNKMTRTLELNRFVVGAVLILAAVVLTPFPLP